MDRAQGNQVAEAQGGVAWRGGGSIVVLAFDAGGAAALVLMKQRVYLCRPWKPSPTPTFLS